MLPDGQQILCSTDSPHSNSKSKYIPLLRNICARLFLQMWQSSICWLLIKCKLKHLCTRHIELHILSLLEKAHQLQGLVMAEGRNLSYTLRTKEALYSLPITSCLQSNFTWVPVSDFHSRSHSINCNANFPAGTAIFKLWHYVVILATTYLLVYSNGMGKYYWITGTPSMWGYP